MLIILLSMLLIVCGCVSNHPASDNYNRVAALTNSELRARLQLKTWGTGVHMKEKKINVYEAFYKIDKPLNVEDARNLILNAVVIIKKNLNSDSRIQQYLYSAPVEISNLLFSVQYYDLNDNSKMSVTLSNENLYYDKIDPNTFKHTLIYKESYEEAMEKAGLCKSSP